MGAGIDMDDSQQLDIDDFQHLMSELLRAKLRASFKCIQADAKPCTSRESLFLGLINRGMYSELREHQFKRHLTDKQVIETIRKLNPWNKSEFLIESSPVSDPSFNCTNSTMLEDRDEITFPELKKLVKDESSEGASCRTCAENRHEFQREGKMRFYVDEFHPVDCALHPLIRKRLGIRVEIRLLDVVGMKLQIEEIAMGKDAQREFNSSDFPIDASEYIHAKQSVILEIDGISEARTDDVRQIWRSRGYREVLEGRFDPNQERVNKLTPDSVSQALTEVKSRIETAWNPSAFSSPPLFLSRGAPPVLERGRWPVQYMRMNRKFSSFISLGLSMSSQPRLEEPILVNDGLTDGQIDFGLDNIELWR